MAVLWFIARSAAEAAIEWLVTRWLSARARIKKVTTNPPWRK